jgi:hypothetical protein
MPRYELAFDNHHAVYKRLETDRQRGALNLSGRPLCHWEIFPRQFEKQPRKCQRQVYNWVSPEPDEAWR